MTDYLAIARAVRVRVDAILGGTLSDPATCGFTFEATSAADFRELARAAPVRARLVALLGG